GVAFMLTHILQISVGQTFSGGLIDFLLFGVLQGNAKTNWLLMLPLGVVMFCLYYFSFRFLIQWRHLNTPGREQEEDATDTAIVANERAAGIVRALGGRENIVDVDCCATRLRVTDKNANMSLMTLNGSVYRAYPWEGRLLWPPCHLDQKRSRRIYRFIKRDVL
ncbi:MAG: PTS transporter subunit EIIB, partial [Enterobacter hormaechei]